MNLKEREWGEFEIGAIFKVSRGKRFIEKDRKKGDFPYYSASSLNNGLTDFIKTPLFIERNSLIVTTFGDSYFVKGNFTASDVVSILKSKFLNEYSGKFIAQMITHNREKFAFGYQAFTERIKRQKILLPITPQGEPDYVFMEDFMRQKEQEKLEKYKSYITKRLEQIKDV